MGEIANMKIKAKDERAVIAYKKERRAREREQEVFILIFNVLENIIKPLFKIADIGL